MEQYLKQQIKKIEDYLQTLIPKEKRLYSTVFEAMAYSLQAGGKRIRPVLCMEFYKACGGQGDAVLPFAAAIEMIHTYSLIHDDLPCMDNDDLRRGKPTNHKVFGEGIAVLAGDALLNRAAEVILTAKECGDLRAERVLAALKALYQASGADGMIGGQIIDLESEGKTIGYDTLVTLQRLKTGALFRAAVAMGCIAAGGTQEQLEAANRFAEKLGLAFQIRDDILDVTGDSAVLGKPTGSDAQNEKSTFVTALGLDKSRELVKTLTAEAVAALDCFEHKEFFVYIAQLLGEREK